MVVQRVATRRHRLHLTAGMKDVCAILPMETLTVQQEDLVWEPNYVTVHVITAPAKLYTKRREKIETTSCPLLGISIPVK